MPIMPKIIKSFISLLVALIWDLFLNKTKASKIIAALLVLIWVNLKASIFASRSTLAATPPNAKPIAAVIKINSARCFTPATLH